MIPVALCQVTLTKGLAVKKHRNPRVAGLAFLGAGTAFLVAASSSGQAAFNGVGVAFIALGVVFLGKARQNG